ncbi:peptidase M16 family protein [Balneatrix alpica]|uniref:Insulinase family protein n=1 Tax=Balneatrix alpica TaxID=75684 RepID=A0ABV5ZFI1_9GAMM|nr:insulinase family protein [Balneatrix alpica]
MSESGHQPPSVNVPQPLFNRRYLKIIIWVIAIAVLLLNWYQQRQADSWQPQHWQQEQMAVYWLEQDLQQSEVWTLSYHQGAAGVAAGLATLAERTLYHHLSGNSQDWFLQHQIALTSQLEQDGWHLSLRLPSTPEHRQLALQGLQQLLRHDDLQPASLAAAQQRLLAEAHINANKADLLVSQASLVSLYGHHPYGLPQRGQRSSLEQLDAAQVSHFIGQYWQQPQQLLLYGSLSEREAKQVAEQIQQQFPVSQPSAVAPPAAAGLPLNMQRPQLQQLQAWALQIPVMLYPLETDLLRFGLAELATQQGLSPSTLPLPPASLSWYWQGALDHEPPSWPPASLSLRQLEVALPQVRQRWKELAAQPQQLALLLAQGLQRGLPSDLLWHYQLGGEADFSQLEDALTTFSDWPRGQARLSP